MGPCAEGFTLGGRESVLSCESQVDKRPSLQVFLLAQGWGTRSLQQGYLKVRIQEGLRPQAGSPGGEFW